MSDYVHKSCGTRCLREQNPTLELVARRNWPSYMFKDRKHKLYSATHTHVHIHLNKGSYKDHITGYYCVINVVLKLYVTLRHTFVDFTTNSWWPVMLVHM